jgi:uncharacterized protein YajQ (UPF0234 family)
VLCLGLNICKAQAPEKVLIAFNQKFANVTNIKWSKENSTEYEANFEQNGKNCSANFATDGSWLETETEVDLNQVPEIVKKAFYKKFSKDKKIKAVDKIEKKDGTFNYEIEYKSGLITKEIVFDTEGNVI